jgi:ceramide glucosyltransferase
MLFTGLSLLLLIVALVGCSISLGAMATVRVFGHAHHPIDAMAVKGITVLKPLHGTEPRLYENLLSFLMQEYAGEVQIVFGVGSACDPALVTVRQLMRDFPNRDLDLVIGDGACEGNAKIANLVAMSALIRHEIVVLSDSDMQVRRRYLQQISTALAQPGVGLVTCLYRGESNGGAWSLLSSMAIDFHFLPSVLLGLRLNKARPCMGATMAFSTQTLQAIGGFATFSRHLADDYAIGEAVRAIGQKVVVAPQVIVHRCSEQDVFELFLHEVRWARTLRAIDPAGFAGSFLTNPLPFAIVAVGLRGFDAIGLGGLIATLVCRAALQWQVERTVGIATHRWLLTPVRDVLSFAVFCASFVVNDVVWRGHRYRIASDGTLTEYRDIQ